MRQGDGSIVPDLNKRDTPKRPKKWTKGTDLVCLLEDKNSIALRLSGTKNEKCPKSSKT